MADGVVFPAWPATLRALVDSNVCGCARRTPLHAAAFAEDVAGLQLVLRHGAEINTVDKSGRSGLMVAADKGHSGTVGECQARAPLVMCKIWSLTGRDGSVRPDAWLEEIIPFVSPSHPPSPGQGWPDTVGWEQEHCPAPGLQQGMNASAGSEVRGSPRLAGVAVKPTKEWDVSLKMSPSCFAP